MRQCSERRWGAFSLCRVNCILYDWEELGELADLEVVNDYVWGKHIWDHTSWRHTIPIVPWCMSDFSPGPMNRKIAVTRLWSQRLLSLGKRVNHADMYDPVIQETEHMSRSMNCSPCCTRRGAAKPTLHSSHLSSLALSISISLFLRIYSFRKYALFTSAWLLLKKKDNKKCKWGNAEIGTFVPWSWECKMVQSLWEKAQQFFRK